MGIANYFFLEGSGKVTIVPKEECQRCKALKERK